MVRQRRKVAPRPNRRGVLRSGLAGVARLAHLPSCSVQGMSTARKGRGARRKIHSAVSTSRKRGLKLRLGPLPFLRGCHESTLRHRAGSHPLSLRLRHRPRHRQGVRRTAGAVLMATWSQVAAAYEEKILEDMEAEREQAAHDHAVAVLSRSQMPRSPRDLSAAYSSLVAEYLR